MVSAFVVFYLAYSLVIGLQLGMLWKLQKRVHKLECDMADPPTVEIVMTKNGDLLQQLARDLMMGDADDDDEATRH